MLHLGLLQSSTYSYMSQRYSGLSKCHDSQHPQKGQIIQTGWSLHLKMFHLICIVWQIPMVDMFATNLNHKLPFYVASPVCKCFEHRCIKHLVGGSGLLGLLSCTTHSKKVIKQVNTRCKMIVVAPWWPMMYWVWDLVNRSATPPLQLLHWSQKQPFSQKYHQNLLYWHLHAWHLNTTQNLLYLSLNRG